MFNHRRLWSLLLVGAALPFTGCLSSPSLTSIVISPNTVTVSLVPPGVPQGYSQYTAIGYYTHPGHPAETQDITSQVTWSSSEPQVAVISNTGVATATGFTSTGAWIGLSDITASAPGFNGNIVSNTSTFNVTACTSCTTTSSEPVVAVTIIPATQTVSVPGQTGQFIALGTTGTGLQVNLTSTVGWNSSAPNVATINSTGLATAKGQGTATITAIATNPDGSVVAGTGTFTVSNSSGAAAEPISSVSIIPSTQSVAGPGATGQFIAIATSGITGLQSDITNQVAWSSSSASVATINSSGLATAVGQGTTAITAIATNPDGSVVTGSAAFTVTGKAGSAPEPIASVSIIPSSISVASPGGTGQFIAIGTSGVTGLQTNITSQVTWGSSTPGVATISGSGLATGVSQGTSAITAIAKNPDGSVVTATGTFTVLGTATEPVTSLAIVPTTESVALPGQTGQFIALGTSGSTGLQTNLTSKVVWTSTNKAVAVVSSTGLATAVAQGSTTITALATNPDGSVVSATASFTVTNVTAAEPVASLAITPSSLTVASPNQTGQFIAIGTSGVNGLQSNQTNQVKWSSSTTAVATISQTGLATGISEGTSVITAIATNPDGSVVTASATFTVTGPAAASQEPIASVAIVPSSISVSSPGTTGQFIAIGTSGITGLQTNITTSVTWSSSTTAVGTIGASTGLATGVSPGTTSITAIAKNPDGTVVTASATFTVLGAVTEPISSLTIVPADESVGAPGETGQFIALGTSGTGVQTNLTNSVAWSSTNATVAVVSASGLVTAVAKGSTTITALATNPDGSVTSATANFTVTGSAALEPVASLTITPSSQAVSAPGGTGQFIALATSGFTGLQSNVTSQVTWSSSALGVATVSPAGIATGVGQGSTVITAQAKNPDGSVVTANANFTVTNAAGAATEPIASVTIIPSSLSVAKPGETGQFIAIATSGTGAQSNVTTSVVWSSSTPAVGAIGASTGLATGAGQGTTAITAIATNPDGSVVTASASFSVTAPAPEPITALTISPNTESVALPGQTGQFIALGTSGTTGLEVNLTDTAAWSSSNAKIAAVSSTGLVTGLSQGSTTITALVTNPDNSVVSATAQFTVTNVASEPLTSLTIIPGTQSLQSPGQSSAFIAIGTTSSGTTENLTNSVAWSSSDTAVATIQPASGIATAVNQGTTAIIAVASNPDGSVVTGTATLTVIAGQSEPITAITIFPTSMSLSASGQMGNFVAIGTSGITGLQEDVTNSPQLKWTSSITTFATVSSYPTNPAGVVTGVGAGDVTILAEWTNPDNSVVSATATVDVTSNPVPEPLLSLTIIPAEITVGQLQDTGNFLAIGTFSTSPQVRDLTQSVTWLSSLPNVFPVNTNTGGNTGATAGIVTAEGIGTAVIIAEATDATTGSIQTATATFSCPYLLPAPPQPGSCYPDSQTSALLSTVTVYNEGLNTTNWLVTAPSATGTPDVIHCGPGWTGTGGSVCSATYPIGTPITLTAPAGTGNFGGWSADCTPNPNPPTQNGPNECILTPTTYNETVGAIFNN
jgi:uncharacterized protein YjdB